jgi:hypothetical protein
VVLIPFDAGEKTSHRYKLSLTGDRFELLETWCIENEASSGKTLDIPSCPHVLLCHDVEGTIVFVHISGKTTHERREVGRGRSSLGIYLTWKRDLLLNCLGWEVESGLVQVLEQEKGHRSR